MTENDKNMQEDKIPALMKQAFLLDRQGKGTMAVMAWRKILFAFPDHVPSIYYMSDVLYRLGRLAEAEAALRVALERASGEAHVWVLLGKVLADWGRESEAEAEECFHNAIARSPDIAEGHIGLGQYYLDKDRVMEAMVSFQTAADMAPENPKALRGLGEGWWVRGQNKEALRNFKQAYEKSPMNKPAELRYATALLSTGNQVEGWPRFEARLQQRPIVPANDLPIWDGSDLKDRRLIVVAEGGFCETIQFCRIAVLVLKVFPESKVSLVVPDALLPVLETMRWPVDLLSDMDPWPDAAAWVPLLSIPSILKMDTQDIPDMVPYLSVDAELGKIWEERLDGGLKIAISWSGGEPAFSKRQRYIPLEAFGALTKLANVSLVSVQKGGGCQEISQQPFTVLDFNEDLDEMGGAFLDTLAILEAATLVITVDNAIAHLAGALGKPVWVLLPAGQPDWRWSASGRDTPWYPLMELFSAEPHEGWNELLSRVSRRLEMMQAGLDPDALDQSLQPPDTVFPDNPIPRPPLHD